MGHRANFVIVREGRVEVFYDQWAGSGSTYTFASGAHEAEAMARETEPTSELMAWAWAEGGYLLDYDEKTAIVFGHPEPLDFDDYDEPVPELEGAKGQMSGIDEALLEGPVSFLRLVAPKWKGWLLKWDERGVDAFAEHLKGRGITTVETQAPSHPEGASRAEFQA